MSLPRFLQCACLLAFLLVSCVTAGPKGDDSRPQDSEAPYVSRLDDPQSNAYFQYARARLLLADGDQAGAAEAYQKAIAYDPDNLDLRFELADLYIAMNRTSEAVRVMEDVLLRNPDSINANLTLANAYLASRQPDKAIPYYRHVLELEPDDEQVQLHLAVALMRAGDVDLASAELKELLKQHPESIQGRLAMARFYRETGLNQLAVAEYRELIRQNPDLVQAYLELGLLYEELKEWQNALDTFSVALKQRPLDFTLRHHLARVYVGMKKYDEALAELGIIVDLNPDDFDARRKIGLIYLEQEKWEQAIAVFREILDLNPQLDTVRYYLGTAYEQQSEWPLALDAFLAIEKDSALYDDALAHISYIYMETDRPGEAIRLLESRVTEAQPRPQIFYYLASLYMLDDQKQKAFAIIDQGLELYPDNVDLLYQRALLLERYARHDEAMLAMQELLTVDSNNAEALNFVAYGLALENRNLDQALEYAERAVKLKPAPHILDTLGWVYYRLGRFAEALKVTEQANQQLSEDAVVYEHLGDIHLAMGNLEKARSAYARALEMQPDNAELRNKLDNLANPQ